MTNRELMKRYGLEVHDVEEHQTSSTAMSVLKEDIDLEVDPRFFMSTVSWIRFPIFEVLHRLSGQRRRMRFVTKTRENENTIH